MSELAASSPRTALDRWFKFQERRTTIGRDTIAGMTTFIVMSYIIFVNPAILGFAGVPGLAGQGLPFEAVLTSTCLVAGVMTILMGLYTNMAYAIAPGLGLNAVVAFTLVAQNGLGFPEAMGLILIEGLAAVLAVLIGLREAIMRAIPLELKKAIAIGIGLFIAFIGLYDSGLVVGRAAPTPVDLATFTTWPVIITLFGLIITIGMRALRFPGDLLIGIIATTVFATLVNWANDYSVFDTPATERYARWPEDIVDTPDFSLIGDVSFDAFTTLLFFPFMFFAPLIGMVPPQATAPALIIVGWLMISVLTEVEEEAEVEELGTAGGTPTTGQPERTTGARRRALAGIDFHDIALGLSAAIVIMFMPFSFSITDGIAAGFIVYVLVRSFQGLWRTVHPLMWGAAIAFALYFAIPILQQEYSWI